MIEEDYLKNRVEDQIKWYDSKSKHNKNCYNWLRGIEIVLAASIPVLTGVITIDFLWIKDTVAIVGSVIVIIASVISLLKLQENWIAYRIKCESLRHEKFLFLLKTKPYDIESAFSLFVQRVESLISSKNSKWF